MTEMMRMIEREWYKGDVESLLMVMVMDMVRVMIYMRWKSRYGKCRSSRGFPKFKRART